MERAHARLSYTALAPLYDAFVGPLLRAPRRASLAYLGSQSASRVLLVGIGTGLDLPWLPAAHHYVGVDITRAMLEQARVRRAALDVALVEGDAQSLPFADDAFEHVIMHLILAVVSDPVSALSEAARVVKPGGTLIVLDKFLRAGQRAPARRLLNRLASKVATRLDVVFEDVLASVPSLLVASDAAVLLGGWFRRIELRKVA
jgi:phosphatidylethanolamine/phosphatidyl-N-methylethanolamine N-methyltransferase